MGSDTKKPRAATVEDCDEDDKVVSGTKQSASTKAKSKGEGQKCSPTDQKAHKNSVYSSQMVAPGSQKSSSSKTARVEVLKTQPSPTDKEARRKSTSSTSTRSPTKASRPTLTRSNVTSPPKLDTQLPSRPRADPSYFGVSPNTPYTTSSSSSSTRPSRPISYYAGMPPPIPTSTVSVSRPPMSRSAFFTVPSYPLASSADSYMRYVPARPDSSYEPEPPWPNHLAERFARVMDPIPRTASAQGTRTLTGQHGFDLDPEMRNIVRRRVKEAEDMPPPPLPARRRSVTRVTDGRDPYDAVISYDQRPARTVYREPSPAPRAHRRPSISRPSTHNYRTETSDRARRSSYYEGQPVRSSDYEDKYREAAGYQEQVAGGPSVSLTAEALRKQELTTASSRSTRSSGSRDESDFKLSATTRTTTSRIEDGEDVTIRFKGGAIVNIAGAEIKCDDGAEVNIVRSKGAIRNGSERSASEYGMVPLDERRGRDRRPSINSRSTSKSGISFPARTSHYSFF